MAKRKRKTTARQRAAARRNIRKAQAATRRKHGCKHGYTSNRKHCRKKRLTPRQLAAARRNIKKAQAANRKRRRSHGKKRHGRKGSKKKSRRRSAARRTPMAGLTRALPPIGGTSETVYDADFE